MLRNKFLYHACPNNKHPRIKFWAYVDAGLVKDGKCTICGSAHWVTETLHGIIISSK